MAAREYPTMEEFRSLDRDVRKLALRIDRLEVELRTMAALQSAARLLLGLPPTPTEDGES